MGRTLTVGLASSLWMLSIAFGAGCGDDHSHDGGDGHAGDGHSHAGDGHGPAGNGGHHEPVGPDSGATCPENSTLTYSNFGRKFFADYCVGCHSSSVTGDARMRAPTDHNFDTLAEIDLMADHIDQMAAFGPDSMNERMPPAAAAAQPTADERQKLGEWLACGALE